jgi:hypothetical protein
MYNKNYLSKRPFVIITNRYTPGPHAQTQKKGWSDTAGWVVNEEMTVVDRVSAKHQSYATVIIDVMEAKVIRNSFEDMTNDALLTHYMTKYKAQIQQAISVWMERLARQRALSGEVTAPVPQIVTDLQEAAAAEATIEADKPAE